MFRKFLSPRSVTVGAAAAGGLVLVQAAYLQRTYVPMGPPKDGESYGVIRFEEKIGPPTQAEAVRRTSSNQTNSLIPHLMRRKDEQAPHRNVLIIGDSLVVGIGCKDKPILPQALCRQMAELLKVDISWRALGVNGGDVRTIHKNVLETVRQFKAENEKRLAEAQAEATEPQQSEHSSGPRKFPQEEILEQLQQSPPQVVSAGAVLFDFVRHRLTDKPPPSHAPFPNPSIDAVVVMVGLNDFKKIFFGRTSSVFRRDLDSFLADLRAEVGPQCQVVLPAIPLEETALPEPIKSVAILLNNSFDSEKRDAAAARATVHFIPKPAMEMWQRAKDRYGGIVATDGVHPNEAGYTVFAEYIGQELAAVLKKQMNDKAGTLPGTAACHEEAVQVVSQAASVIPGLADRDQ